MSNTAQSIADYIAQRAVDAFDVVYVPQAKKVQLIVEQQIDIDYNTQARKISYIYDEKGSINDD
ncbi:hypothetical protein [Suttonella ornithocola]|uniref:hypothetical protein n=1 Tax=Suttonella ornithocola TaxID=279832 RepID=UPI0009348540|nr:hypothetical protein [Suttonella ornithocola]